MTKPQILTGVIALALVSGGVTYCMMHSIPVLEIAAGALGVIFATKKAT